MWLLLIVLAVQETVSLAKAKSKTELNPEQFMNISERIQYWGYPSEEYEVLTLDGYYLSLNRIPGGSKDAVLLIHGLDHEGSNWIANLPNSSLGFILADAGYDVWIGNHRGNSWSRRHQNLTIEQLEFWDFSFHEMAIYDLSALTDFILQRSGSEKIYYIGHSEGSTIALFAFSVLPQLASKVKMLFVLEPVYTLQYAISPILQLLRLPELFLKIIFGKKEFCLVSPRLRAFVARTCSFRLIDVLCKQVLLLVSGFNEKNLNKPIGFKTYMGKIKSLLGAEGVDRNNFCSFSKMVGLGAPNDADEQKTQDGEKDSRTDVYMSRFPDYTSVKQILHWSQLVKTREPRYFDYGSQNMEKYNQTIPPRYRIEEITVPIAMWSGGKDWVSQPQEIEELRSRLKNIIHYKHFPDWDHWDFVWGIDAPQRMYSEILSLMEK